jgi:hypothetical protein
MVKGKCSDETCLAIRLYKKHMLQLQVVNLGLCRVSALFNVNLN